MEIIVKKKELIWSYIARFFQISASLVLLPFILKFVPESELGIWYVYLAISSLVLLFDFGFQPTILRNVAYVYSGAKHLLPEGMTNQIHDSNIDYCLLKTLIYAVRKVYRIISILALITMLSVGLVYIHWVCKEMANPTKYLYCWVIFSIAFCIDLYYLYFSPLLLGRGLIYEQNKLTVLARGASLMLALVGVTMGYGLIAMLAGLVVSTLITRLLSFRAFYDSSTKNHLRHQNIQQISLFPILWKSASKMGLVSLGSFLINRSSIFFVTSFTNLATVASYGLTNQLIIMLLSVSQTIMAVYTPRLNSLRAKNDLNNLISIFSTSSLISMLTFLLGSIFILLFGNLVLNLIGSKTALLPFPFLIALFLINSLEMNHSHFATLITTKNTVPFLYPALISGGAIIFTSYILFKFSNLGLWSVIISQGAIQLMYNNWKWPLDVCNDFDVSYFHFIKTGAYQILSKLKLKRS